MGGQRSAQPGGRIRNYVDSSSRSIAGIFAGSRDTTPSTGKAATTTKKNKDGNDVEVPLGVSAKQKLHAPGAATTTKAKAKEKKALEKQRLDEERAAERIAKDEERRREEEQQLQQQQLAQSTTPPRGRPPSQSTTTPNELFDKEAAVTERNYVTDAQLSGQAPPDLERYMRAKTNTLPKRSPGQEYFNALDRRAWPSCAVPSPSDFLYEQQEKCFGPPSTTYFVDPSLFGVRPQCPQCSTSNKTVPSSWNMKPLFGAGERNYVMFRTWRCKDCEKGKEAGAAATPTIPFAHFFASLPADAKASLPIHEDHLYKNYFVDKKLVKAIDSMMVKSTAAQISKTFKEMEKDTWHEYHHSYATKIKSKFDALVPNNNNNNPMRAAAAKAGITSAKKKVKLKDLGKATWRTRWSTLSLSDDTIRDIYKASANARAQKQSAMMYAMGGEILYVDHTFAESKHIRVDGVNISAVLSIMNEKGQIPRQWAVRTKSLHELEHALKDHFASYAILGLPPPKVIYVDNVEEVETLLLRCYPSIQKQQGGFGVKQCPTHALRRMIRSLSPGHGCIGSFIRDLSYAMYEIDDGDKQKVKRYLRKTGRDPDDGFLFPRSFWHGHACIRRRIKAKGRLAAAVESVWNTWVSATNTLDVKTGQDLFTEGNDGTHVEFAKFKSLCENGYLSDPEGMEMSRAVGPPLPKSGLQVYRSLRGSSHLEGYHCHLHKATRDAPNHGPVLAQALLRDLNFRFSLDSSNKNVDGENHYDCYTPWVLDEINVIYSTINGGDDDGTGDGGDADYIAPYPNVFVNKIVGLKCDGLLANFKSPKFQQMYNEWLAQSADAAAGVSARQELEAKMGDDEETILKEVGELASVDDDTSSVLSEDDVLHVRVPTGSGALTFFFSNVPTVFFFLFYIFFFSPSPPHNNNRCCCCRCRCW